jgi:DEAD/DEAH box helicase domain-containing protein
LQTYIERGGNSYLLSRRPHLPRFHYQSKLPAFVAERSTQRFDPVLGRSSNRGNSWLEDWALKCLGHHDQMLPGSLDVLYSEALPVLVRNGILSEWETSRGHSVWGLRPNALIVEAEVSQLTCSRCGHNVSVAALTEKSWEDAPCLRYQCTGTYEAPSGRIQEYYQKLYSEGDLQRIVAREHTGLLGRDQREKIEKAFKGGRRPWEPNLLSCTPTLELGVDVGRLSSVILCSVPPSTASFVQRIGRGGRRSGNAIDVTVANGRPHDLYFFEDPTEMIDGEVEPPGVFLGAVEVLVRQFVAYAFDRWVASGIPEEAVPSSLSRVLRKLGDEDVFPHTWLGFVGERYEELFEDFRSLFGDVLTDERVDALREALSKDDGIQNRVLERLAAIKKRRKDLHRRSRRLYREIKKKEEEGPMTEAKEKKIEELRREKTALQNIFQKIGDTNTYNFFTDAGLLPNYAFPESGVTLRSILYRKPQEGGQQVWDEEFVRPAPQALGELAPGSTFYADGRRVVVDQIDLSGDEVMEKWRLCDRCSFMQRVEPEEPKHACPRCGSPSWSDQGQEQLLVKHDEVRATTWDRESRIDDSSESREREFYETAFLASFQKESIEKAYRIDSEDTPFGFEYVKEATFREVNFGRPAGQPIMEVGGQEIKGQGFRTCSSCGRVAIRGDEIEHTRSCSNRGEDGSDEKPAETLFLYREIQSEAVRILLPESTMSVTPEKVESFKAALELGLKEFFEGSVDHLKTVIQEGPGEKTTARRRYLLLYDSVPGGTGYLADMLREKEVLMDILEQALSVLTSCPCAEEAGRDGCYQCLYAYRNHYDMPHTSRSSAQELLEDILRHRDDLLEIETVDKISIHGTLESELEARFLQRLRELELEGSYLEKGTVRGQHGYKLKIGGHHYDIEPQVTVGPADGVPRRASVDFVIHPEDSEMKPIAVFLDGLQYHRNRIGTDLAQRRALRASGQYHIWSLTWRDVTREHSLARNYLRSLNGVGKKLLTQMGESQFQEVQKLMGTGSFGWLIRLLATRDAETYRRLAFVQALLLARDQSSREEWVEAAQSRLPSPLASELEAGSEETPLLGLDESPTGMGDDPVTLWSVTTPKAVQSLQNGTREAAGATAMAMHLDDRKDRQGEEFEASWNGFLRLYNLLQFVPESYPVSTDEEAFYGYEELIGTRSAPGLGDHVPAEEGGSFDEEAWADAKEFALEEATSVMDQLYEEKVPAPSVPYELVQEGEIVAEAELGWEEAQVAVLAPYQEAHHDAFGEEGWTVFQLQDVRDDPTELLRQLQNGR